MRLRLRDDDRTRRHWTDRSGPLEARSGPLRARGRTRRRRTVDDGRVAVAVMVVVVMVAADGGEGQGSDNQQGEDFTHGHVSLFDGGIGRISFFRWTLPTNIIGEWDFLIYFIKKMSFYCATCFAGDVAMRRY